MLKLATRSVGSLLLVGLIAATPLEASSGREHSTARTGAGAVSAANWVGCGTIKAEPRGRHRIRKKGHVTCRGARKLMRLLFDGEGTKHGGPAGYQTYYTLFGWKCGFGAGGAGCIRHRRRDQVLANWVRR